MGAVPRALVVDHVAVTKPSPHPVLGLLIAVVVCPVLVVACGDDGHESADSTTTSVADDEPVSTTDAPPTTRAPRATEAPPQTPPATQAPTTAEAPPPEVVSEMLDGAQAVCRGEGSLPGAAAYDPAAPGPHPVLVLVGDHPDYGWYAWEPIPLPDSWAVDLNQSTRAQLVACIDRRDGLELAQVCEVSGAEDRSVEIYAATDSHVTLYEAATGETIAAATVTGSEPKSCPLSVIFSGDQTVVRLYSAPSGDSLSGFLSPHVEP